MVKVSLLLFIIATPFFMVADYRWAVVPLNVILAVVLFGIDEIATEIEQPFGSDANDINLEGLLHKIDTDIATMLAHREHHEHISLLFSNAKFSAGATVLSTAGGGDAGHDANAPLPGLAAPPKKTPYNHAAVREALRKTAPAGTLNTIHNSGAEAASMSAASSTFARAHQFSPHQGSA